MAHQGPAALGIAVVAMSEELGTAMAHRALEHLLQYGEPPVRSACLHLLNPCCSGLHSVAGTLACCSRLTRFTILSC